MEEKKLRAKTEDPGMDDKESTTNRKKGYQEIKKIRMGTDR